jgi:hypothetical protein
MISTQVSTPAASPLGVTIENWDGEDTAELRLPVAPGIAADAVMVPPRAVPRMVVAKEQTMDFPAAMLAPGHSAAKNGTAPLASPRRPDSCTSICTALTAIGVAVGLLIVTVPLSCVDTWDVFSQDIL